MRKQIVFMVLSVSLGALLFAFSLRSIISGQVSAYEAEVVGETAVCDTFPIFPISPHEGIRSVTSPGTGVNPYPDISEVYPGSPSPPAYEDFTNHQDDVPLSSAQEGTVFRVRNGTDVGGFSWLAWNTIYPPPGTVKLIASLTWPGNIGDYPENGYYDPSDPSDMSLDIDDWVQGYAGNVNSNSVRDALNDLIVQERILRLPIWNDMSGSGSSLQQRIISFGLFRLHGHNVVSHDSWLLLEFVGWDNYCEQVAIDGPTTGVQDTVHSFTASVSPITVTLPLTYRWEATGQTAVTHITNTLTDTISYSWPVAGTKTVTVTVNDGMETAVVSTHTIQIDALPPTSTPTPTFPTSTPIPTPIVLDLVVVGAPKLISTPPIVAYQPVSFRVTISNTGNMQVIGLFSVDIFFDPDPPVISTTIRIPISQSDGYTTLYSLAEQTSRVITITSLMGFQNEPSTHLVYAMVDPSERIYETDETNNISAAAILDDVEPANTPTPTPLPTPLPCGVEFEGHLTAGDRYAWVTGDIGVTVELYDLTTSTLLGTDIFLDRPNHVCPGFADFTDSSGVGLLDPLVEGHVILAIGDDGTDDSTIVLAVPPTSTPTPTPAYFIYLPIIRR